LTLPNEIAVVLAGELDGCVVCADCLDVMPYMPDGCVDAVVTDPPYMIPVGAAFVRKAGKEIDNGDGVWNTGDTWRWLQEGNCIKPGGNLAVFHRREDVPPSLVNWWHKYYLVKRTPPPTPRPVFVSAVEECSIGSWPGGKRKWYGTGFEINYWLGCADTQGVDATGHPAQKPLAAMLVLIRCLSAPGDIILDPFCGSGTTLVAAKKLGRRYIGIEISEKYCQIARNRLAKTPKPIKMEDIDKPGIGKASFF